MTIHESLNKLFEKYSIDEEGLVDHLKSKFSAEYKHDYSGNTGI